MKLSKENIKIGKFHIWKTKSPEVPDRDTNVMPGWWISWNNRMILRRVDRIGRWERIRN